MIDGSEKTGDLSGAVQAILQTADALLESGSWAAVGKNMMSGVAEGILSGADFVNGAVENLGRGRDRGRRTESISGGGVTQNIYLHDSDVSPYRTARRIRRESEAIFRN